MISGQTFIIFSLLVVHRFDLGRCELYTSADELSRWPTMAKQFSTFFHKLVQAEEERLDRMQRIRESLLALSADQLGPDDEDPLATTSDSRPQLEAPHATTLDYESRNVMLHPIGAFVTLHRLVTTIDDAQQILEEKTQVERSSSTDEMACTDRQDGAVGAILRHYKTHLPSQRDLTGAGEAVLRLQEFYQLDIDDLVEGTLPSRLLWMEGDEPGSSEFANLTIRMNADDCFELGRIAFQDDRHNLAIRWLLKALEFVTLGERGFQDQDASELLCNILEYMAFSAYKVGELDYAIKLTKAWLERDPHNERALDNLQYYAEELEETELQDFDEHVAKMSAGFSRAPNNETIDLLSLHHLPDRPGFDTESYSIQDDHAVRELCLQTGSKAIDSGNLKCHLRWPQRLGWSFGPTKLEVLSEEPRIVRLHEVISEKEADHIRSKALPKLERSTIHSGDGLKSSDFRLAKTAWLARTTDPTIERIENRLGSILNLNLESSEHLQVVNYGLGGFYGPHLDSARSTAQTVDDSSNIGELERSDRLATILIYLNQIGAGGSTVFPRLNIVAPPLYRSAVVWDNILSSGWSDERTLHTGCPVLLGSKWIATKWPREAANSFTKPCKHHIDAHG